MSLHTLAHHLQGAGRGDDSVLVHMTPREVSGLQSLAMAHGGSLTINPDTGLPEAGFLSGLLPTLIGAGLTIASGGAISPITAGLLTGGAGAVATGSLSKGLMMGLGAYGGAGLAGNALGAGGVGAASTVGALKDVANPATIGQTMGSGMMAPNVMPPAAAPASWGVQGGPLKFGQSIGASPAAGAAAPSGGVTPTVTVQATPPTTPQGGGNFMGKLLGWSDQDKQQSEEWWKQNRRPLMAAGLSAAVLSQETPRAPRQPHYAVNQYDWNRRYAPSSLEPGSSAERTYFAADGGLASLPIEQMSQQNAMTDNVRYPMAFQNTPTYATPSQRPVSQNVIYPATDADVTPYSGTSRMAGGGIALLAAGGTTAKQTPAEKAKATAENKIKELNLTAWDPTSVKEPKTGWTSSGISSAYKTPINAQQKEVDKIQNILNTYFDKNGKLKKPEYQDAVTYLQGLLETNKTDVTNATTAKTGALQSFGTATTRGSTAVGTRGIESLVTPSEAKGGGKDYVTSPGGSFVEKPPTKEYKKLEYGKINALTGWDNKTKKFYELEDVTRVFEEVAGRKATQGELDTYVGSKGTMQGLVNSINKNTADINIPRGKDNPFTDAELQSQAQYYWGREMKPGELSAYKKENYKNFAALRQALTTADPYVDYLNKINTEQFTKENAPPVTPASKTDISSTFVDVLGRKPTQEEMKQSFDQKIGKDALVTALKATPEFEAKLVQEPIKTTGGNVTTDTTTVGPGGGTGGTGVLPEGGGTGKVPAIKYTTMTPAELEAYKKQYSAYQGTGGVKPVTGQVTLAPAAAAANIYNPQYVPNPFYQVPGAMEYRDPNYELGLRGLYQQMSEKIPELQQGLDFRPQDAVAMKSALPQNMAAGGYAGGGYNLGDYSDGGRLLRGPGDGVSDSIPASIGNRQPARLADGEFVIPARIVSELGNGSTDAGARKLYAMMDRIQKARKKSMGDGRVAVNSRAEKMLPI